MSFNKSFNSNNKFILGSTKIKSPPSTGGPTLSLNNENHLVISSVTSSASASASATTVNAPNNNHNQVAEHQNDELISLLENINHNSRNKSPADAINDKAIDDDEGGISSSSSEDEAVDEINEKRSPVRELKASEKQKLIGTDEQEPKIKDEEEEQEKDIKEDIPSIPHESSSHSVTVPVDVTKKEIIKPFPSMDVKIPDKTETVKPLIIKQTEEEQIPFDFQKFLKQLKSKECEPIVKYIKSFMKQFSIKNWSIDDQAKLIKDFERFIFDKFVSTPSYKNLTHTEEVNVKEGFEKLIMSRLYTQVFPPALINTAKLTASHKEELVQDLKLAENLIRFQWIENKHLDIPAPIMENAQSFITLSSNELNKLNNYKSPRDKIICVLNCCKVIFGLIRKQQANTKLEENADTFVPLLIYIILKSRPKHLVSNIGYIERFRNESFLGGESMYYLSSLQLAVNFIIKVDAKLLTIDEQEFNSNVAKVEAELKAKREEKKPLSPIPLLAGRLNDERLQDLSPSQILATSANALQQKFNQIFAQEEEPEAAEEPDAKVLSKVKKLSIKEHQEQVNSDKKSEEVLQNLKSIFPNIDTEILKDIVVLKNYNIGDCIDSCLELQE